MKATRIKASDEALLDLDSPVWANTTRFPMFATPLAMAKATSPYLAISEGHGVIENLEVAAIHNGSMIAIGLKWAADKHDQLLDVDTFVDGVAVLFPLARGASAMTMGSQAKPANAWYWKADESTPYEVVAKGFGSVQRFKGKQASDLKAVAQHRDGHWQVIFRRSMGAVDGLAKLLPARGSKIAFAVWDGGNAERSGRKSFSGDFMDFEIQK